MKSIATLKADFYNVFVEGAANDQEKARVFILLFIPLYGLYAGIGKL